MKSRFFENITEEACLSRILSQDIRKRRPELKFSKRSNGAAIFFSFQHCFDKKINRSFKISETARYWELNTKIVEMQHS